MARRFFGTAIVAMVLSGLFTAGSADAHTISIEKAETAAKKFSARKVRESGDYSRYRVFDCKRQFPHRVRCKASYFSRTSATPICSEWVLGYYLQHRLFSYFGYAKYDGPRGGNDHEC